MVLLRLEVEGTVDETLEVIETSMIVRYRLGPRAGGSSFLICGLDVGENWGCTADRTF